jgi:hypothetical protein
MSVLTLDETKLNGATFADEKESFADKFFQAVLGAQVKSRLLFVVGLFKSRVV